MNAKNNDSIKQIVSLPFKPQAAVIAAYIILGRLIMPASNLIINLFFFMLIPYYAPQLLSLHHPTVYLHSRRQPFDFFDPVIILNIIIKHIGVYFR